MHKLIAHNNMDLNNIYRVNSFNADFNILRLFYIIQVSAWTLAALKYSN